MSDSIHELGAAVHESTRRTVEAGWPEHESAGGLLDLTGAALTHVEQTIDGFRQLSGAGVDCRAGCSFCCWLRVDVRAHEVFLVLRWLRSEWPPEELATLQNNFRILMSGIAGGERRAAPRPCLLLREGRCSVYAVRPAACRRYLSGSVEACEALWKDPSLETAIQYPLLAETGRYAATAVHNTFVQHGYDGYSYDLTMALSEALEDPACGERWIRKEKAFSAAAESVTPPGFSQQRALEGLTASLAAAASRPGLLAMLFLVLGSALPSMAGSAADPVPAAAAAAPAAPAAGKPLTTPGDHVRRLTVDGVERSCLIHLPPGLDPAQPTPLLLVLHGAGMNAGMMASFSGMNAQSDSSKFIAVYPNGSGYAETFLTWNSGGLGPVRREPDDVAFIRALLDDLGNVLNLDSRRIFAAGMSNGAMMAYRLGAELSDRIAAIAAVGGTLAVSDPKPARPVPVIHFHGVADRIVPYAGPGKKSRSRMSFRSVPDTIDCWAKLSGCPDLPVVRELPDRVDDGTTVKISRYGPGTRGAEVVLVDIVGGGHTWPGQQPMFPIIGKSTKEISANQMIWEFFQKHPMDAK